MSNTNLNKPDPDRDEGNKRAQGLRSKGQENLLSDFCTEVVKARDQSVSQSVTPGIVEHFAGLLYVIANESAKQAGRIVWLTIVLGVLTAILVGMTGILVGMTGWLICLTYRMLP